jgi:Trk-type K+ transport system membrane component
MKKLLVPVLIGLFALTFLSGCSWSVGSGAKNATIMPTLGQQLVDLQKAKEAGAITDAEYQAQKAKLLGTTSK